MTEHRITTPLSEEAVRRLRSGDRVFITGPLFTARDEAHRRLDALLREGHPLPLEIRDQVVYYAGPTPARPGNPMGSAGPTSSYRMDSYAPALMAAGLKGMIGKGERNPEVRKAIVEHRAVYLAAVGGAGALISKKIIKARIVAYPDLGPEAIYLTEVKDFPCIVINDIYGGDLYEEGKKAMEKQRLRDEDS